MFHAYTMYSTWCLSFIPVLIPFGETFILSASHK